MQDPCPGQSLPCGQTHRMWLRPCCAQRKGGPRGALLAHPVWAGLGSPASGDPKALQTEERTPSKRKDALPQNAVEWPSPLSFYCSWHVFIFLTF